MIHPARTPADLADIRTLLVEYGDWLGEHLDRERFTAELARLPGDYAPPEGTLLLAHVGQEAAGCVGIRPLGGGRCELKRLYTRERFRGHGLGRQLLEAAVGAARTIGYRRIQLDTLSTMKEAQVLYQRLGFREIPPYREDQAEGMRFLELTL